MDLICFDDLKEIEKNMKCNKSITDTCVLRLDGQSKKNQQYCNYTHVSKLWWLTGEAKLIISMTH